MRLWHKDLVDVLPQRQLLGQWRECCAIAKNIKEKGTPGHLLVNKIMGYDTEEFLIYARMVWVSLCHRGISCDWSKFEKYYAGFEVRKSHLFDIFSGWHNWEYLDECYYNLREKWNCGGIPDDEWDRFEKRYFELKKIKEICDEQN